MRISGKIRGSAVDGPGYNYVIFMQGCSHACDECHNPDTWSFKGGNEIEIEDLFQEIKQGIYTGVTLSGGDPMDSILKMKISEFNYFLSFLKDLKELDLNIICYTGYYINELIHERQKLLLDKVDVLIDGPFEKENKKEIPFRGSTNQNLIALTEKGMKLLGDSKKEVK